MLDLLKGVREYVYPVGRLDYDSEGLLLLTNDGDLAARLTHPRHEVERVYEAQVLGVPDSHDLERLARGIVVEGRRTAPATVELLSDRNRPTKKSHDDETSVIRVTIHEGRTRQVRKMGDAIRRLRRVRIGPLSDSHLKPGTFRELTNEEIRRLKSAGRTSPSSQRRDAKPQRRKPDSS